MTRLRLAAPFLLIATVAFAGSFGGGGGHVIQDEGVTRAPTSKLNFVGTGVSCAVPTSQTEVCTVSGAAGGPPAFTDITDGTNAGAAMTVGTGASLGVSGSGTIVATSAAANPANCSAGQCAGGIGADFAAESCIDPLTAAEVASSAALAALIGDSTGTDVFVRGTSPTIVTPTIGNFINAQHNHQTDVQGGVLDSSAVGTGVFGFARGGTNQTSWTANRCVQVNATGTALESANAACGSGGGGGFPSVGTSGALQTADGAGGFLDSGCTAAGGIAECPCVGDGDCHIDYPANTAHPDAPSTGCRIYALDDNCLYAKCAGDAGGGAAGHQITCASGSTSTSTSTTSTSTTSTSITTTTSTSTTSTSSSTVAGSFQAPTSWVSATDAFWKMEESATPWANSGGCGTNCDLAGGQATQSASAVEGSFAASFSGASPDGLTCGTSSCAAITTGMTDPVTFCGWFIPATGNANGAEIINTSDFDAGGNNSIQLTYQSSGSKYQWRLYNAGVTDVITSAAGDTPVDVYRYVCGVANGTAISVTVNGFTSNSKTSSVAFASPKSQAFRLSPSFSRWTGHMDAVTMDHAAWTLAQQCRAARCGVAGEMCMCNGSTTTDYLSCVTDNDCRKGGNTTALCNAATSTCSGRNVGECTGGANDGLACLGDADCTGGACTQCTITDCDAAAP